jgi:hypothetical protein
MRRQDLTHNRFQPRGIRPVIDSPQRGTTADTIANFRQRLAALEAHTGVKPPAPEAPPKPIPVMGHMHGAPPLPRMTQIISTAESRTLDARRAGRAEVMYQHNIAGRFFSGPVESSDARVPRASATGSVV